MLRRSCTEELRTYLLSVDLPVVLRYALDDKTSSVILAALKALKELCVLEDTKKSNDVDLDDEKTAFFDLYRGYERVLHPSAPDGPPSANEEGEEDDAAAARRDVISALVKKMTLLPRLRYVLEVAALPGAAEYVLAILVSVADHSEELAGEVFNCPRLVDFIMTNLWNTTTTTTLTALKLIRVLCQASRDVATQIVDSGKLTLVDPSVAEVLRVLRVCAAYNLAVTPSDDYLLTTPGGKLRIVDRAMFNYLERSGSKLLGNSSVVQSALGCVQWVMVHVAGGATVTTNDYSRVGGALHFLATYFSQRSVGISSDSVRQIFDTHLLVFVYSHAFDMLTAAAVEEIRACKETRTPIASDCLLGYIRLLNAVSSLDGSINEKLLGTGIDQSFRRLSNALSSQRFYSQEKGMMGQRTIVFLLYEVLLLWQLVSSSPSLSQDEKEVHDLNQLDLALHLMSIFGPGDESLAAHVISSLILKEETLLFLARRPEVTQVPPMDLKGLLPIFGKIIGSPKALLHSASLKKGSGHAVHSFFIDPNASRLPLAYDWLFGAFWSYKDNQSRTDDVTKEEDEIHQSAFIDRVKATLYLVLLLHPFSYLQNAVTPLVQLFHIMRLFVISPSISCLFDPSVQSEMSTLLNLCLKDFNNGNNADFESSLYVTISDRYLLRDLKPPPISLKHQSPLVHPSVFTSTFFTFFTRVVEVFDSESFGHEMFGQCVLLLLQMKFHSRFRELVWSKLADQLRLLNVPPLGDTNDYLYPYESNGKVLVLYDTALKEGKLTEAICPFLYRVANHHLSALRDGLTRQTSST